MLPKQLIEGARVCAYWSQKFSCLYPGTVRRGKKGGGVDPRGDLIYVQFDDGDRGRIPLEHIRMLPQDLPILGEFMNRSTQAYSLVESFADKYFNF